MSQPDLFNPVDNAEADGKIRMIMALRSARIDDARLLRALERVPREPFLPPMFAGQAYEMRALPISAGQTLESPVTLARMLAGLKLDERSTVLEIGTGTGYSTAVLSLLARRVCSLEYYHALRAEAQQRLEAADCRNVTLIAEDGNHGWPEAAPYDRILVSAGLRAVPSALLEQLAEMGGRLVAPVGAPGQAHKVLLIERDKWNYRTSTLFHAPFDPIIATR